MTSKLGFQPITFFRQLPDRTRPVAALVAASMLTLTIAACGGSSALDARASVPVRTDAQQPAFDPALDSLDAVTHHG